MSIYAIALFFHIVGALALFATLTFEWVGLRQTRNAGSLEQTRPWLGIINAAGKAGFPSMLTTVITGVYMMVTVWGQAPWLATTVGALVLMIVLARVASPRLKTLEQSLVANDVLLWVSVQTRVAIVFAITFLKIAKPGLADSLLIVGVAVVLGVVSALSISRRHAQMQTASTD